MLKNRIRGFGSPSRYIQGPGVIQYLKEQSLLFGKRVFFLIDVFFFDELNRLLQTLYNDKEDSIATDLFSGEITDEEIERVLLQVQSFNPDVVVGIGGGKTLDTVKVVANDLLLPLMVIPTTASTDAPCSAMSIIYRPNGTHHHERYFSHNPDVVLVDSEIICKAPVRFLLAGMGDAISTYIEARANETSGSNNYVNLGHGGGYQPTKAAMALAKLCYEIILANGVQAKKDVLAGICSEALENIIEANTLLSGVGFENTGCAGAHALNYAFANVPGGEKLLHGEKVAFGVIVQLIVEKCELQELESVCQFYCEAGLPLTLEDLGVDSTEKTAEIIAKASMGTLWDNEPVKIEWMMVKDAIIEACKLGRKYHDAFQRKVQT